MMARPGRGALVRCVALFCCVVTDGRICVGVRRANGDPDGDMDSHLTGSVSSVFELTSAIERATAALTAGSTSTFSSDCIVVTVSAPNVPDLTLIDLPGIVRTATAGQHARVIAQVNEMINSYLRQERTIVLAIVPANQDVATVDILERALAVDPTGERTIGVLTKPDLVGEGAEEEVVSVLKNERKPLKLGYVMVKNRSAKEQKAGLTMDTMTETRYFREHEVWRTLPSESLGITQLTAKLTKLLAKRIQNVLPELKWELQTQFADTEKQQEHLGSAPPEAPLERAKLVLRIFAEYCAVLRQAQRGDYREQRLSQNAELRLRGRADGIFRTLEKEISEQKPDFDASDFTLKLYQELKALRGRELPGLLNSYFFYGFMARHVEMWRPLIESAKTTLYDASFSCASVLAAELLVAYPGAAAAVRDTVAEYLDRSADAIAPKIEDVFKHESDPFISKNELSEAIEKVRFDRFESALTKVMEDCGTGRSQAAKNVVAERQHASAQNNSPQAKLAEAHTDAAKQQSQQSKDAVVNDADDSRRKKREELKENPLKEMVLTALGRWYMANHSVTSLSMVEDMRTVLIAYWGVASKRITENTCMLLETHLLAALAEDLEKQLLSLAQSPDGDADHAVIDTLLAQDDDIRRQREQLKRKKERLAGALTSLARFAPNLAARAPIKAIAATTKGENETTQGGTPEVPTLHQPPPAPVPLGLQAIETFMYTSNGDNSGFVYWLGTSGRRERFANPHDKGRLRITSSGLDIGSESLLVARKRAPCWTSDISDAWICLDLGRNRAFRPTHYTLCNGSNEPGFDLLAWVFEGYDHTHDKWVELDDVSGPRTELASPWGVATYATKLASRPELVLAYRFLRLRHAGLNSRGTRQLPVCAWEFYGTLYSLQTQ